MFPASGMEGVDAGGQQGPGVQELKEEGVVGGER